MDNTKKFDNRAKAYSISRPTYPSKLINELYDKMGFSSSSVIADIGSGTGIMTKLLLEKGSTVYAVEPNGSMRKEAENAFIGIERFHSVNATAENTTLKQHSVDFITVAQAFHWFDIYLFKSECKRILKEHGQVVLIWNYRDENAEINKAQYHVFEKYCNDFHGFSNGLNKDDGRINTFFGGKYNRLDFANDLKYSREKYIARCLSSSYSLSQNDLDYERYLKDLNELFDKFSVNDILTIPNNTVVYMGDIYL